VIWYALTIGLMIGFEISGGGGGSVVGIYETIGDIGGIVVSGDPIPPIIGVFVMGEKDWK
jgi:hypothetical protein